MWWLGWSIVCLCLKTYHHKWNLATAKWKNLAKPNSSIKFRCDVWNSWLRNSGFLKNWKKGLKQKVTVYQHGVRFWVHLFFSTFPNRRNLGRVNLPWQEFVLMQPGNYTLELYLQDIGQLATWWKGNKRHFSPWRFPESFSFCVCFCWWRGCFLLCFVCFFCFSRKIKATVVIKNNGMTTQRLVLLYDSIGLGWHLFINLPTCFGIQRFERKYQSLQSWTAVDFFSIRDCHQFEIGAFTLKQRNTWDGIVGKGGC